jgi:hypothetical protein
MAKNVLINRYSEGFHVDRVLGRKTLCYGPYSNVSQLQPPCFCGSTSSAVIACPDVPSSQPPSMQWMPVCSSCVKHFGCSSYTVYDLPDDVPIDLLNRFLHTGLSIRTFSTSRNQPLALADVVRELTIFYETPAFTRESIDRQRECWSWTTRCFLLLRRCVRRWRRRITARRRLALLLVFEHYGLHDPWMNQTLILQILPGIQQ